MTFRELKLAYNKRFILTTKTRISLYRKIKSFAESGLSVKDVLENVYSEYKKRKNAKAEVLEDWLRRMEEGASFYEVMSYWVPPVELSMIRSGEQSGDIAQGLENAIMTAEIGTRVRRSIFTALAYPVALLVIALVLMYVFSFKAIPAMVSLLPPDKWPSASKMLYSFSMFVRYDWYWALAVMLGVIFTVFFSLPRVTGKFRIFLDKLPPYSTYKSIQSSAFLIAVASMMKTGTPIVEAIESIIETSNKYARWKIGEIKTRLDSMSAGEALDVNFFDTELRIDIATYGKVTVIHPHLERIGRGAIEETMATISSSLSVASSAVLILIGGYTMWLYYTFFVLNQAVTKMAAFH